MTLVDSILPLIIIVFIILAVWSRIEHKSIMDLLKEIKEKLGESKKK